MSDMDYGKQLAEMAKKYNEIILVEEYYAAIFNEAGASCLVDVAVYDGEVVRLTNPEAKCEEGFYRPVVKVEPLKEGGFRFSFQMQLFERYPALTLDTDTLQDGREQVWNYLAVKSEEEE